MIVYSNLHAISNNKFLNWEFEVLNELNDLTARTDANCKQHTRFLFEMDSVPLEEQCKIIESLKDKLVRITYSGSKSLHCIVEFDPSMENQCRLYYKQIWTYINREYFNGKCDAKCINPSRLTRRPGVMRKDKNKEQKLLWYNPNGYFPVQWQELWVEIQEIMKLAQLHETLERSLNAKQTAYTGGYDDDPNGKTENHPKVKYYLNTSFLKETGNGDSDSSFFTALCVAHTAGDKQTIQKIIDKAKREGWSNTQINHKLRRCGEM